MNSSKWCQRLSSSGASGEIHIGRLRGSLDDLDFLITTPAFPLAPSPKVLCLEMAPSDRIRRLISDTVPASVAGSRPRQARWINVFLGNPLNGEQRAATHRLHALARQLDRLAAFHDRDLLIAGGPRTRPELYDILGSAVLSYHQIYRWRRDDPANPFELMVRGITDSIVTGDSIAMISQLVAAGHRILIFPWHRPRGLLGGVLQKTRATSPERPRKDTAAFRASLVQRQLAAELDDDADFRMVTPQVGLQDELFVRLRTFLR